MRGMGRRPRGAFAALFSVTLTVLTLACVPNAQGQSPRAAAPQAGGATPTEPARPSNKLDKAAASSAQAMAKYRASLEPVQAMYERELERQAELAEIRQELYERGALSATDVQQGRRALAKAQKDVDDIRRQRIEVDRMMVEMRMIEAGKQRPLGRGGYEETPGLVRFNGTANWSLGEDTPKLQRFFQARFGRPLPISAFGQSSLHDQMGFDHRRVGRHPRRGLRRPYPCGAAVPAPGGTALSGGDGQLQQSEAIPEVRGMVCRATLRFHCGPPKARS